jgi:hypothetical protein
VSSDTVHIFPDSRNERSAVPRCQLALSSGRTMSPVGISWRTPAVLLSGQRRYGSGSAPPRSVVAARRAPVPNALRVRWHQRRTSGRMKRRGVALIEPSCSGGAFKPHRASSRSPERLVRHMPAAIDRRLHADALDIDHVLGSVSNQEPTRPASAVVRRRASVRQAV